MHSLSFMSFCSNWYQCNLCLVTENIHQKPCFFYSGICLFLSIFPNTAHQCLHIVSISLPICITCPKTYLLFNVFYLYIINYYSHVFWVDCTLTVSRWTFVPNLVYSKYCDYIRYSSMCLCWPRPELECFVSARLNGDRPGIWSFENSISAFLCFSFGWVIEYY